VIVRGVIAHGNDIAVFWDALMVHCGMGRRSSAGCVAICLMQGKSRPRSAEVLVRPLVGHQLNRALPCDARPQNPNDGPVKRHSALIFHARRRPCPQLELPAYTVRVPVRPESQIRGTSVASLHRIQGFKSDPCLLVETKSKSSSINN
jgi:hypothetical protein